MYFSTDGACHKVTENKTVLINELSSNQEEADTKLCLYTQHALATNGNGIVYARSHSGDVDINVILISKILDNSERVILDFNKGRHRKVLQLADVEMTDDEKKALIGFLAFTSNDYTSAFFRKGKTFCWKFLRNNAKFLQCFIQLGEDWIPSEELLQSLEQFVCRLFRSRRVEDVNALRYYLFQKTYQQTEKIIDLALLPSCQQALRLHCLCCSYVAKIWTTSDVCRVHVPPVQYHGWTEGNDILWVGKAFPDDTETILCNLDDEDLNFEESETDSSDGDDSEDEEDDTED